MCGGACAYDVYIKTGKIGIKENYFCTFLNETLKLLLFCNFLIKPKTNLNTRKSKRRVLLETEKLS